MQNNNAQGLTYNIEASLILKSECSQESNKIRNLQKKCENQNLLKLQPLIVHIELFIAMSQVMFCNSQLVNKVGCFRVFVVFFVNFPDWEKDTKPLHETGISLFFSLVMGISCPSIFPAWELNVPIFSLTWIFHIPKIPQDGILVSQTLSGMGF